MNPRFYFTLHPGDLLRQRIVPGARVMLVASAFWNAERERFRIALPPADHVSSIVIDSGGFTACRRWGKYPWSHQQYIDFVGAISRDVPLDWCAVLDYACEREVNRGIYATNRERIKATIRNEIALREAAPELPWLGVLQGNTLEERLLDVRLRRRLGLVRPLMGVGSICGRLRQEAARVLRFYGDELPGTRFHAFGLDVRTLDCGGDLYPLVASWDSYAWTWPRGQKHKDRRADLHKQDSETYSTYAARLGRFYADEVVGPRLSRPRQMALTEAP